MDSIPSNIREILTNLAELFIGVEADEVIARHSNLIPKGYEEQFKVIMNETNASLKSST